MIAKTCQCGGRIRDGECDRCGPKVPTDYRGNASERGYGWKWRVESERYKQQHPLCVVCSAAGIASAVRGRAGIVVDHIVPASIAPDLFWDRSNWQTLCHHCHTTIKRPIERQHRDPDSLRSAWAALLASVRA